MTPTAPLMARAVPIGAALLVGLLISAAGAQIVTVSVPAAVSFNVSNISVTTTGAPAPVTVSFSNAVGILLGQRVRISVRAESSGFGAPAGSSAIPASSVSWVVTGASGGTGSAGTLSAVSYQEVYRSNATPLSGSVSLRFQLAPLAASGLRAGSHVLTVRWRYDVL